jgi:hypothetical protein
MTFYWKLLPHHPFLPPPNNHHDAAVKHFFLPLHQLTIKPATTEVQQAHKRCCLFQDKLLQ